MGMIARRYILPVIFTFFLPSIHRVVVASRFVMHVAKVRCQQVRVIAELVSYWPPVSRRCTYEILQWSASGDTQLQGKLTKFSVIHNVFVEQND
jgi:hypothetical protein